VRKAWLAPVLLAVALVLQLTVLNGLHLPRGGVPDLVLVLVVALAMADGPMRGTVTGFAAGLCLDIAPPDTGLIGQYALVFCLAGWAAGSLGRLTRRSPLRALAVAAVVIAAAEAMTAALGKLLEPGQVSVAEIRQFLPVTIAYDVLICPFVLYLVIVTGPALASSRLAGTGLAGSGLLTVGARSKHADRKPRPHQPRLNPAAARAGDGWVGGGPASHPGLMRRARRPARLHPSAGVPGSASGYAHQRGLPVRPVSLRLSAAHRGDGAIGTVPGGTALGSSVVGRRVLGSRGQARHWHPGRHPGLLAGSASQSGYGKFRYRGELGGSAAIQRAPAGLAPSRLRINFGPRRGDGGIATWRGTNWLTRPGRRRVATPRLRTGVSRSALAPSGRATSVRSVPTVHFRTTSAPVARRPAATPKFRHRSAAPVARRAAAAPKFGRRSRLRRPSAPTTGLVGGGALNQSTFRARRAVLGAPRLRLAGGRRGLGMLGGTGRSSLRRPPARVRKEPRFGYGRRSLLSFLTGRRLGGRYLGGRTLAGRNLGGPHLGRRWLTRKRVGRRSGVWLIGRGTGGAR
jgi:rod shape-determining protein MreD